MNAGADNTYVQSVIETVRVVRSGVLTDVPVDECGYSYKKSVFQTNGDCIAGCVYRFRAGNVTEIAAKVRARRFARSKLPKGRSVGLRLSESAAGTRGRTHRARGLERLFDRRGARIARTRQFHHQYGKRHGEGFSRTCGADPTGYIYENGN